MNKNFKLIKQEGCARRGVFSTVHGTVQTPAFMNVATSAAIKGGISAVDLKEVGCQVALCNTYHLHVRPGDEVIRALGGLHRFMRWDGQRWVSGVLPGRTSQNQGRGRIFCFACRRKAYFYGPGGEHADSVSPGVYHCDGV